MQIAHNYFHVDVKCVTGWAYSPELNMCVSSDRQSEILDHQAEMQTSLNTLEVGHDIEMVRLDNIQHNIIINRVQGMISLFVVTVMFTVLSNQIRKWLR